MARSVPDKVPVTAANHNGACPDGARFPSSAAAVRAGLRVPGSSLQVSACSRSGSDSAKLAADEHRTTRRVIVEPDAGREAVSP